MSENIVQALIDGVAVAGGLFVLWSLVGRMKTKPASERFQYALLAGVVSAVVMFVIRLLTH